MTNSIIVVGRLTRDPEKKNKKDGSVSSARLSVAVERDFKAKDAEKRETDFFNCTVFRGTADYALAYAHKGDLVSIEGRLENLPKYTNKEGKDVYPKDEINVSRFSILSRSKGSSDSSEEAEDTSAEEEAIADDDEFEDVGEELPF